MKYNIRKNWTESFSLIVSRPVVILPFLIIAFLEALALELIYFSPRKPLALLISPIVRKFFGEPLVHYPANLLLLPKLLYYAKVLIYIFIGALLAAVCASMVRNIRENLPLKFKALLKNAFKNYLSLFIFGVVMVALMFLLKRANMFVLFKIIGLLGKHVPPAVTKLFPYLSSICLFFSNIVLQVFLVLTIPVIMIKKKVVFKALGQSIVMGGKNFFSILALTFLPLLVYLPIGLLQTAASRLMEQSFPEMILYIEGSVIALSALIEGFIMVCMTQFLLDKEVEIASAASPPRND